MGGYSQVMSSVCIHHVDIVFNVNTSKVTGMIFDRCQNTGSWPDQCHPSGWMREELMMRETVPYTQR